MGGKGDQGEKGALGPSGERVCGFFCSLVAVYSIGSLRFEYEYKIEYENDFSIVLCRLYIITTLTHFIP